MSNETNLPRMKPINWMTLVSAPQDQSIRKLLIEFGDDSCWKISMEDGLMKLEAQNILEQQKESMSDNMEGMLFHNIRGDAPTFDHEKVRGIFLDILTKARSTAGYDPNQWRYLRNALIDAGYNI